MFCQLTTLSVPWSGRAFVSLVDDDDVPFLLPNAFADVGLLRIIDRRDDLRGALPGVHKLGDSLTDRKVQPRVEH